MGRYKESKPSVNCNSLNIAWGFGVIVLSKSDWIERGINGVGVIVGVSETDGVNVIDGVNVMVGVREMVGVSVIVGVIVTVAVGG
jgi:hypothetical protein